MRSQNRVDINRDWPGSRSDERMQTQMVFQRLLAALRRDDQGQGLAEYALILALIAIIAIVALIFLGGQVSTILSTVGNSV
jgi:pilus assembly protein Flp/PilA